ncbi:MAG: universal stress protein, partial [Polaromonas sp.]|nr:universal stress protein [Polaromonas sp.]
MKILIAADGSKFTKKALAFLVTHENFIGPNNELVVLHVQPPVPSRVKTMVGTTAVHDYYRDEAEKVLEPIRKFLKRHTVPNRTSWVVGSPPVEIVRAAQREKAHLIAMGTH